MTTPLAPLLRDQRKVDAEHLKLLAVFHFVFAGLCIVGIGFLFAHWAFLHAFFANPELWKGQNQAPPPKEIFTVFRWFYLIFGILLVLGGVLNLISGLCLRSRRARIFSLIIAGLDILQMPFGTTLGVFTFIVLLRPSVVDLYEANTPPPVPSAVMERK